MNTTWLTDNKTTFIKVCGLREEESVDVAVGSGVHAIGFVFVPSSPRVIEREEAEQVILQGRDGFNCAVMKVLRLLNRPRVLSFAPLSGMKLQSVRGTRVQMYKQYWLTVQLGVVELDSMCKH